jgi:hypothetical protein
LIDVLVSDVTFTLTACSTLCQQLSLSASGNNAAQDMPATKSNGRNLKSSTASTGAKVGYSQCSYAHDAASKGVASVTDGMAIRRKPATVLDCDCEDYHFLSHVRQWQLKH